jgi:predicted restriction endonuclease
MNLVQLGRAEGGPDDLSNMLCVCANCHALLDLKAFRLDLDFLRVDQANHKINASFVDHHNEPWQTKWRA